MNHRITTYAIQFMQNAFMFMCTYTYIMPGKGTGRVTPNLAVVTFGEGLDVWVKDDCHTFLYYCII